MIILKVSLHLQFEVSVQIKIRFRKFLRRFLSGDASHPWVILVQLDYFAFLENVRHFSWMPLSATIPTADVTTKTTKAGAEMDKWDYCNIWHSSKSRNTISDFLIDHSHLLRQKMEEGAFGHICVLQWDMKGCHFSSLSGTSDLIKYTPWVLALKDSGNLLGLTWITCFLLFLFQTNKQRCDWLIIWIKAILTTICHNNTNNEWQNTAYITQKMLINSPSA